MRHLFVDYDLALIAKDKGFNENCFGFFNRVGHGLIISDNYNNEQLPAPLYQQLQDFFRDKGLHINIEQDINIETGKWYYRIHYNYIIGWFKTRPEEDGTKYNDYYKALSKAFEQSFKII